MDKYTVDLDKVLNDFEYSELTDNFGSGRSYLAQGSSSYASSSKSRTGDAKHSITNVFHSLNEYLNTDISVNPKRLTSDSNKENLVQNSADGYENAPKHDDFEVRTGNLLDLGFTEQKDDKETSDYIKSTEGFCKKGNDKERSFEEGANEVPNRVMEVNPKIVQEEHVEECNLKRANVSTYMINNLQSEVDTNRINKVKVVSDEPNLEVDVNMKTLCTILTDGHNLEENFNLKGDFCDKNTDFETKNNDFNLEKNDIGLKPISDSNLEDTINSKPFEVCEEKPTVQNEISNLNNNFYVLENPKENSNLKNELPNIEKETFEVNDELPNIKNELSNHEDEPRNHKDTSLNLKDDTTNIQDDLCNLDDNPRCNRDNPPNQNEDLNAVDSKAKSESSGIEVKTNRDEDDSNLKSETEKGQAIVRYDDTIEIDDSTLNQFLDDLEVEFEAENTEGEIKVVADSNKEIETDRCESAEADLLERPRMLRLSSGSEEETKKREINLIGEPGSTPYNNLYISKELSSENVKDAAAKETESSVSPTFSEASTDTISDSSDPEMDQQQNGNMHTASDLKEFSAQRNEVDTNLNDNETKQNEECGSGENMLQPIENAVTVNSENDPVYWLGKQAPLWIPDSEALSCLHCDTRFTVIKRRHHCRACGLVLCSKCCNLKYRLEYLDAEARVCLKCYEILNRDSSSSEVSPSAGNSPNRQPNPNNPMEYCSVVPPLQQVGAAASQNPPTVMVPVGVLKRKGSNKKSNKSVMFCDGIRPGSDLTKLDGDFDAPGAKGGDSRPAKSKGDAPKVYSETLSFVPKNSVELPPLVTVCKSETTYYCNKYSNDESLLELLKTEKLTFAFQKNIFVHVKIIDLNCCIGKKVWCFSTEGFLSVGQDEIVYLLEFLENETCLPIDIFNHLNIIYNDALKGTTVSELGISLHDSSTFLDFKNHAGFLYIRPTFQCVQNIIKPNEPYLVGLLIHRWETPWAKIFPLRLVLRLGAEYRYYPSPLVSTRFRDSLFVELGHTIITVFADFRNFSYTLPNIRGLTIHMQDKNTTVNIPTNRYDQVMSSLNNSSDHILVLGGNFSTQADSHLVCIQDTQSSAENAYTTHAINIQNRPRTVTGASFIVFNGALKSTSGLTAKSSIVEDGLMIQISAEDMGALRENLRNMKDHIIQCGCVNAPSDETVNVVWSEADSNFNVGVVSPIDNQLLSGVPSIRVHNGKNYTGPGHSKTIRWTEVFILQNTDERSKARDPLDISKISEGIAKATCAALVKYLDLLCSNNFFKIGIRTTLHVENVSYSAGSNNVKLPPIYMKSLDNELIPVLHRIVSNNLGDDAVTLELIFRILNS